MDDLMKAIMAGAEQEIAKANKLKENEHQGDAQMPEVVVEEKKHQNDAKVDEPKSEPLNPKPEKVIEPTWSAETQETSILPAMLEPRTSEPVEEKEHQADATLKPKTEQVKVKPQQPAASIEVVQPKVDAGIKLFVGMGGSFFLVALGAAVYTALKVTGVM